MLIFPNVSDNVLSLRVISAQVACRQIRIIRQISRGAGIVKTGYLLDRRR